MKRIINWNLFAKLILFKQSVLIAVDFNLNTVKYFICITTTYLTPNLYPTTTTTPLHRGYNITNNCCKILNPPQRQIFTPN